MLHSIIWLILFSTAMMFIHVRNEKDEIKWKKNKKLLLKDKILGYLFGYLYFYGYVVSAIATVFICKETHPNNIVSFLYFIDILSLLMLCVSTFGEILHFVLKKYKIEMFRLAEYATEYTSRFIIFLRIFPILIILFSIILKLTKSCDWLKIQM